MNANTSARRVSGRVDISSMMVCSKSVMAYLLFHILQAGVNVFLFQVRIIILNDLVKGQSFVDQFQHILYCDTRPFDDRLARMDLWVNDYSIHGSPLCLIVSPVIYE